MEAVEGLRPEKAVRRQWRDDRVEGESLMLLWILGMWEKMSGQLFRADRT